MRDWVDQYVKKPVTIDAFQWDGTREGMTEITDWMNENGVSPYIHVEDGEVVFGIPTLEGVLTISSGDFVIKGVQGEFYPCKPDIFEKTYESEEDSLDRIAVAEETAYWKGYDRGHDDGRESGIELGIEEARNRI